MQRRELAARRLEEAVTKPGLKGAAIGASVAGVEVSDASLRPLLAQVETLGAVLFIDPRSTPELARRFEGAGWISNVIGNPLDTTIAWQRRAQRDPRRQRGGAVRARSMNRSCVAERLGVIDSDRRPRPAS